jgi:hypothetical protein
MSVIQMTVSCTVSLVQLRVQCCILTLCCGFQFALQFVIFNLLLQYVSHSVYCQLYCQFGSADSTVLYTDCCGFQLALQFVTFNLLLEYVCHSVDCQLYCQFGSADSTVLYKDFVFVAFSLH